MANLIDIAALRDICKQAPPANQHVAIVILTHATLLSAGATLEGDLKATLGAPAHSLGFPGVIAGRLLDIYSGDGKRSRTTRRFFHSNGNHHAHPPVIFKLRLCGHLHAL